MSKKLVVALLVVVSVSVSVSVFASASASFAALKVEDKDQIVTMEELYRAAKDDGFIWVTWQKRTVKVSVWLKKADRDTLAVHIGKKVDDRAPRFLIQLDPAFASHCDYGNGRKAWGGAKSTDHENFNITKPVVICVYGGHIDFRADPATLFDGAAEDTSKPVIREKGEPEVTQTEDKTDDPFAELLKSRQNKKPRAKKTK